MLTTLQSQTSWLIKSRLILCFIYAQILNSCVIHEPYNSDVLIPNSDNYFALKFIEAINSDKNARLSLESIVDSKSIFFNEIQMNQCIDGGLYYTVPYGNVNERKINGSIFYPVAFRGVNPDNSLSFDNFLGKPIVVNSDYMNQLPINKKFNHSFYFERLQEAGYNLPDELLKYLYLREKTVITNIERPKKNRDISINTRASIMSNLGYEVLIYARVFVTSHFSNGICYGMSAESLERSFEIAARLAEDRYDSPFYVIGGNYEAFDSIKVRIATTGFGINDDVIRDFMHEVIVQALHCTGLSISFEYDYCIDNYCGNEETNDSDLDTYTGGASIGEERRDFDAKIPDASEFECEQISATKAALDAGDVFNAFMNAVDELPEDEFVPKTLNDYFEKITQNGNLEYSTSLKNNNGNLYMPTIIAGTNNRVELPAWSGNTVLTIHNHPNETPPSPLDLLNFISHCMDSKNTIFKGDIVLNPKSNIAYVMTPNNTLELEMLYNRLSNDIDIDNNAFKENSDCHKVLENYASKRNRIINAESLASQLQLIAETFAPGAISMTALHYNIDLKNKRYYISKSVVYGNRKSIGKHVKYSPIKCNK